MLSHCYITNLATVKNIDLDFQAGMTAITGETGAGKSVLLEAIRLCFGDRADSSIIRPNCEKAEIACTFDIRLLPSAIHWLTENEFIDGEPTSTSCIIRRILYTTGRSKAFINGSPVTGQQLKSLGEILLQIHGQHQYQLLLKPSEQLRLLDAFGGHAELLSSVHHAYTQWKNYFVQKQNLLNALSQDTSRIALLRYQVAELNELQLKEDEIETLDKQHHQLCHAQSDIQDAQQTLSLLSEDVLSIINQSSELFKKLLIRHPVLQASHDTLNSAHIQIRETINDLNQFCHSIDSDPEQLHYVEQRLNAIYDMARKHKIRPEMLLSHFQKLESELALLNNADEALAQIEQHLAQSEAQYLQIAKQLSNARQVAGQQLSKAIEEWLTPLGMPGGQFNIMLIPQGNQSNQNPDISPYGLESVQFCVSANPGHPPQALNKVASGGELSRISLAVQMILAQYLNTPTLIFDEIDTGVSGKIGAIIGKALQTLSKSVQVLCITHLPQVAAFGEQHINVIKHRNETDTYTTIEILTAHHRVEELARMLGGIDITQQARDHAKELLDLCTHYVQ